MKKNRGWAPLSFSTSTSSLCLYQHLSLIFFWILPSHFCLFTVTRLCPLSCFVCEGIGLEIFFSSPCFSVSFSFLSLGPLLWAAFCQLPRLPMIRVLLLFLAWNAKQWRYWNAQSCACVDTRCSDLMQKVYEWLHCVFLMTLSYSWLVIELLSMIMCMFWYWRARVLYRIYCKWEEPKQRWCHVDRQNKKHEGDLVCFKKREATGRN